MASLCVYNRGRARSCNLEEHLDAFPGARVRFASVLAPSRASILSLLPHPTLGEPTRMTRKILAGLAAAVAISIFTGTGCQSSHVGDPCTPEQEYDPSFLGFAETEVSVASKSFQCQTRLCLVNHFQGRVSCPYGQQQNGQPIAPTLACAKGVVPRPDGVGSACNGQTAQDWGCCAPGTNAPISGWDPTCQGLLAGSPYDSPCSASNTSASAQACNSGVLGQDSCRTADTAVYCSCRCADVNGQTNDGANYCTCPDGFTCTQLVSSIGVSDSGLTGAYCMKNGTGFTGQICSPCDPTKGNCGTAQGITGN